MTPIRARDLVERLFWTFVAVFLSTLIGSPAVLAVLEYASGDTISIGAIGMAIVAAALAGLIAVGNAILIIARWRLSVLPNPGEGLPGLPTGVDTGATTLELAFGVFAATFVLTLGVLILLA